MNARIVLDQPVNATFTNLDLISGRVLVRTAKSADVQSILVKLEGESRTRLQPPPAPAGERSKPQMEYHKILYKVQMVFPPSDVLEGRANVLGGSSSTYTLPPGQHEYPFRFKLPFNNACHSGKNPLPTIIGLEVTRPAAHHVKRTLPPTISGFPGEAEIRYYVKATVNRRSIFKENPRAFVPFTFLPIEPPRPTATGTEIFARQKHEFSAALPVHEPAKAKMKGLFGKKSGNAQPGPADSPYFSVDARLPQPAILTCNQDIPLRMVVKKLRPSAGVISLHSLQIAIVGYTKIRAHEVFRTELHSWVITSRSNMGIALGNGSEPVDHETVIDDQLWRGASNSLANTIAPSFVSCNIDRVYQLDVRIGLSYSSSPKSASQPETVILPLRLNVEIFSGIAPPAEVLARMAAGNGNVLSSHPNPSTPATDPMLHKLDMEGRSNSGFGANQVPMTPIEEPSQYPAAPQGSSAAAQSADAPPYADAPPSYEDAIAADMPSVNAPRPQYAPPPAIDDALLRGDEKKGWVDV